MEQQKTKQEQEQEQEYAPNGKPIVYELEGEDKSYYTLSWFGVWSIVAFLFFSFIGWLDTGDWEAILFTVFGAIFISIPTIIYGKKKMKVVYRLSEEKKKKRKFAIIFCIILFTISFLIYLISGGPSDKSVKHNTNKNNNNKDGFYGSDGKYHEYIPEFGDDVNDWMENNW